MIDRQSKMEHDVGKETDTVQRCYKEDDNWRVFSALRPIQVGQYVYLDRPLMNTSAAENLVANSYK